VPERYKETKLLGFKQKYLTFLVSGFFPASKACVLAYAFSEPEPNSYTSNGDS
jgi:hypothetical protein